MLFKTAPIAPPKQKTDPAIKKAARAATSARRKPKEYDDSQIYGSTLFEPIMKREREIIIKFRGEFTDEGIHFSIDGKLGYKLTHPRIDYNDYDLFNLYYMKVSPIIDPPKDFILVLTNDIQIFENIDGPTLEEKCIELFREELKTEKEKLLADLRAKEKLEQASKDLNEQLSEVTEVPEEIKEQVNATTKPTNIGTIELFGERRKEHATKAEESTPIQVEVGEKEEIVKEIPKVEEKPKTVGGGFKLL